jgi:hypothetical protein
MPWAVEALDQYLKEVRHRYPAAAHPALWLTERGGRISPRQVDDRFALWRTAAGLPGELSVHCLLLHEQRVDPVLDQVRDVGVAQARRRGGDPRIALPYRTWHTPSPPSAGAAGFAVKSATSSIATTRRRSPNA